MPDWISDSFCFFFSAYSPPNHQTKTINKSRCSPTESKGDHIKHGNLAYLHRGRRQRCTCGRARRRPRSTAARSPRTPRSWLLPATRLDLYNSRSLIAPAKTIRQRRVRGHRIEQAAEANSTGTRSAWLREGKFGGTYVFDRVRIAEPNAKEISTLALFVSRDCVVGPGGELLSWA